MEAKVAELEKIINGEDEEAIEEGGFSVYVGDPYVWTIDSGDYIGSIFDPNLGGEWYYDPEDQSLYSGSFDSMPFTLPDSIRQYFDD